MRLLVALLLLGCNSRVCTLEDVVQDATPQRVQECQQAKKAVAAEMCNRRPAIIPIPGNPNMSEASKNEITFNECVELWRPVVDRCLNEKTIQQKMVCK